MAGLSEVAREAGLSPVRCPHCGRSVRLDAALSNLFDKILDYLKAGKSVSVRGFGTFRTKVHKGRSFPKSFAKVSGHRQFKDKLVIAFKQSVRAKALVNAADGQGGSHDE